MLPARNRMRRAEDYAATLRRGVRGAARTMTVHLNTDLTEGEPLVGFAVSRAVGSSVVRHRVQRRLRHLMRDELEGLHHGSRVVVRALPPAATATSAELAADLHHALAQARRRVASGRSR